MPERYITVYSCSVCEKDIDEKAVVTFEISWPSGERARFDLCPACHKKNKDFLDKGEQIARKSPGITKRVNGPAKVEAGKKLFKCPDCSYTHYRPQSLAVHRSRMHGYKSPRRTA